MSDLEEVLTDAAESAAVHGRLPGAAEIMRRGRRRTLRQRGGAAAFGVAVAGAVGVTALHGTTDDASAAGPAATSTEVAHGSGFLPAAQWPGYDRLRWTTTAVPAGSDRSVIRFLPLSCDPPLALPQEPMTTAIARMEAHPADHANSNGNEMVWTYATTANADKMLAEARTEAVQVSLDCPAAKDLPAAKRVLTPGPTTDYGVSWTVRETLRDNPEHETQAHVYVVRIGNRVAQITVVEYGSEQVDSAHDKKVLEHLRDALLR